MRIQHNIMAMNAYRNYTNNVSAMKKNLEKLSSGYKINRAGDDAAGLAISEKMRAQITGLQAAQKNAKDGISLVQTAEGALTEVHDMLNRMVELATQSANGTYDNQTDRYQLQKEVNQLRTEIDRIADSANFNGIQLLDGSMSVSSGNLKNIDGGVNAIYDANTALAPEKVQFTMDFSNFSISEAEDGATVTIAFGSTTATSFTITVSSTLTGKDIAEKILNEIQTSTSLNGSVSIDGMIFDVGINKSGVLTFTSQDYPSSTSFSNAVSVSVNGTKVVAGVTPTTGSDTSGNNAHGVQLIFSKLGAPAADGVVASASFSLGEIKDGTALKIGDVTYIFAVGSNSTFKGSDNVVDLTRYTGNEDDFKQIAAAYLSKAAASNAAVIVTANGADDTIVITERLGGLDRDKWDVYGASATDTDDATWKSLEGLFVQKGTVTTNGLMLQIGDTADAFNQMRVSIGDTHVAALGLDTIDISTQESAAAAIKSIKAAINQVSDIRGTLGATQNRLDHTINNLSVMTENIQDAESTIRDVDIAEEMMAYTKNNILIQSAQAMLAQANQIPQGVLQLLQ